jgi:hypothetical protein
MTLIVDAALVVDPMVAVGPALVVVVTRVVVEVHNGGTLVANCPRKFPAG